MWRFLWLLSILMQWLWSWLGWSFNQLLHIILPVRGAWNTSWSPWLGGGIFTIKNIKGCSFLFLDSKAIYNIYISFWKRKKRWKQHGAGMQQRRSVIQPHQVKVARIHKWCGLHGLWMDRLHPNWRTCVFRSLWDMSALLVVPEGDSC